MTKAGVVGHLAGQRISERGFYQAWRRDRTPAGCPGRAILRKSTHGEVAERLKAAVC